MAILGGIRLCLHGHVHRGSMHLNARWRTPAFRKVLLLAFGMGFYAWVAGKLVVILMLSVLINHG